MGVERVDRTKNTTGNLAWFLHISIEGCAFHAESVMKEPREEILGEKGEGGGGVPFTVALLQCQGDWLAINKDPLRMPLFLVFLASYPEQM